MGDESKRRKLEAALASARTTVQLLELELAETDDERWATAQSNPFQNPWTFRRLCKEGAFPCVEGVRRQKKAKWRDVVAWMEAQAYRPPSRPSDAESLDDFDPFAEALADGSIIATRG